MSINETFMGMNVGDIIQVINFICMLLTIISLSDGIVMMISAFINRKKMAEEEKDSKIIFSYLFLSIVLGAIGLYASPFGIVAMIFLVLAWKKYRPKHIWLYILIPVITFIIFFIVALYVTINVFFNALPENINNIK